MNHSEIRKFFSIVQIWVLRVNKFFFLQFLVDILPLGSGSVDPDILADPDPGSKILRIRIISTGQIISCFVFILLQFNPVLRIHQQNL